MNDHVAGSHGGRRSNYGDMFDVFVIDQGPVL
jgi:hypothetical protein